jgi:hypothetical protein
MRGVLTTICAVRFLTSIVLGLGLSAQARVSLAARGNGCSKRLLVEVVLPVLLLEHRVRPGMATVFSLCTQTVKARGLSAVVHARLRAPDSGHRRQHKVATGWHVQLLPVAQLGKASVRVHARQLPVLSHTFEILTQLKACVAVPSAMRKVLTTICAATLVQLARRFSVLTDGWPILVLLRHCVLARRAMRGALTTLCAAMKSSSRRNALHWCVHQILMSLTT